MNIKMRIMCKNCNMPLDESLIFLGGDTINGLIQMCPGCTDKSNAEAFQRGVERGMEKQKKVMDAIREALAKAIKSVEGNGR